VRQGPPTVGGGLAAGGEAGVGRRARSLGRGRGLPDGGLLSPPSLVFLLSEIVAHLLAARIDDPLGREASSPAGTRGAAGGGEEGKGPAASESAPPTPRPPRRWRNEGPAQEAPSSLPPRPTVPKALLVDSSIPGLGQDVQPPKFWTPKTGELWPRSGQVFRLRHGRIDEQGRPELRAEPILSANRTNERLRLWAASVVEKDGQPPASRSRVQGPSSSRFDAVDVDRVWLFCVRPCAKMSFVTSY
jgi:hypothetical protein